jgi:type III restriction enzyme
MARSMRCTFLQKRRSKLIYPGWSKYPTRVEFYFKLPPEFTIPTPIGNYNPDWALVLKRDRKIYFVAETKASLENEELRKKEDMKMKCGEAHFKNFTDVEYRPVSSFMT